MSMVWEGEYSPIKEKGARFNQGKLRWSLVPQSALIPMVRVLEFGAEKYDAHNWKKGLSVTEICDWVPPTKGTKSRTGLIAVLQLNSRF